jgi:glucosamine-6-phosphate deaminase
MDLRERIAYRDDLPRKKRIIVFSPHPDDDVISMGGMLMKLVDNENDITVAYMTNGSVAVFDQDVRRHLRFIEMTHDVLDPEGEHTAMRDRIAPLMTFLDEKKPAEVDRDEVQRIKAYIRYTEAIAAIEVIGMKAADARFLDLPFYRTGRVKKDPISGSDVNIIEALFEETRPDHIFVAGDLSDPHGTHRMCYMAINQALEQYNAGHFAEGTPTSGDGAVLEEKPSRSSRRTADPRPTVWLYRGAWQEWEIHQADIFLPMSKADLDTKIEAIFKHESQKDRALFPGAYDEREFWQRARDRNRYTAQAMDALGLPEFYAMEAYVTVHEMP